MKKSKIKLLAIAPSESIQEQIYEIAKTLDNLEIDVYIGNLYIGVEIVQQKLDSSYDAILSRGETASMIKNFVKLPVIEIPLSFYDILHAIKLADNFQEPYAIVGYTAVTSSAHLLRNLLQLDLDIYTLFSPEDAVPLIPELKEKGYRLIISGMGTDSVVKRNGLNSILITTGRESISSAIQQAMQFCSVFVEMKAEKEFLSSLLIQSEYETLVFDEKYELVFSTLKTIKRSVAMSLVSKELQNLQSIDSVITKTKDDTMISVREKTIYITQKPYTVFYFQQQRNPYISPKNEIQVYSRNDAIDTFLQHYLELSTTSYETEQLLPNIIQSSSPVIILGEMGVGKEQMAATLYTQGKLQNRPYLVIDFALMTDKSWSFLVNNINSPINDDGKTLYFRSLEKLSSSRIDKLKTMLHDTNICRRSRIIFSYSTVPGEKIPDTIINLMNQLTCLSIRLTPLRERSDEIQALSSLYISTLNIDLAKQISGFSKQALILMEQYQWPGNLTQFKRVITQLMTCTASPYIQEEHVRRFLEEENANLTSTSALSSVLNLNKPLNEIEQDIVKAVLAESNGNQSQAAVKLGICRTTLWRIINK